jgi:hypothetical protein
MSDATDPSESGAEPDVSALGDERQERPRRRRWRGLLFPLLFGFAVAAFTYGALSQRVGDEQDLLPPPLEAALLGAAFALASLPRGWALAARAFLFLPTFFLYLSVFLGKDPPLSSGGAFAAAASYAFLFAALSSYFAERPRVIRLRSRRRRGHA